METAKIIAHVFEKYRNMSEEEKAERRRKHEQRLIEQELEELEEERLRKEQSADNALEPKH